MAAGAVAGERADSTPDEQLVEQVCNGDPSAFDALYERYLPRIHGFIGRRMRNRADVEETVQEVFFNLFASLHSYRGDAPFGAWAFGLTRRTLASRFKKKTPVTVPLAYEEGDSPNQVAAPDASPDEIYEYYERLERLERAVAEDLSNEQRTLFELHHLQHTPIQEIAARLGKSEDAIKSHLYRARRVLLAR